MIFWQALFFALPIYLANMAPVFMKWMPLFNVPLDFGKSFRGYRIFGKNKTWRGMVVGIIFAVLMIYLQKYLFQSFKAIREISIFDYAQSQSLLYFGVLLGFGAILGDALKSFFKRQFCIRPGKSWVPFDQLDFVVGGLAFGAIIFWPGWQIVLILVVVTPVLHWLTNVAAYKLKLKDVPW